ncbi:MAG: ABC transporter substrate-binding protein, partial [Delftia sp.]|nr:ABC transporter substrate-binding protein [Delftia sp.]
DYVPLQASLHQPLDQVIAIVQGTPRLADSERFIAFVCGPLGQRVLRRYGFYLPNAGP